MDDAVEGELGGVPVCDVGEIDAALFVDVGVAITEEHVCGGLDVGDGGLVRVMRHAPDADRDLVDAVSVGYWDDAVQGEESVDLVRIDDTLLEAWTESGVVAATIVDIADYAGLALWRVASSFSLGGKEDGGLEGFRWGYGRSELGGRLTIRARILWVAFWGFGFGCC